MNKVNLILDALNESVEVKKTYGDKPEECKKENMNIIAKSIKGDKAPKGNITKAQIKFPFGEKPECPKDNKTIKECDKKLTEAVLEINATSPCTDEAKEFNLKVSSTTNKGDNTTPYKCTFTGDKANIEKMLDKYFNTYDKELNKQIKQDIKECDKSLKESSARRATEDLLQAIEDGFVDEHTVLLACLKYMSEDDVRDMCHDNEFNIADDEDLDECSKASKEA